jgi:hypothetical protein
MLPASFRQNISSFTDSSICLFFAAARAKSSFAGKGYGFSMTTFSASVVFKSKILCVAKQYLANVEYNSVPEFTAYLGEIDASYHYPAGYAL